MKFLRILVLIFFSVICINAQKVVLNGTIYDQSGAIVPNAEVKLKDKNKSYLAVTNDEGVYEFEISKGFYKLEVNSNNFKTFKLKKYFVAPSYKGKMFFDVVLTSRGEVSDQSGFLNKNNEETN